VSRMKLRNPQSNVNGDKTYDKSKLGNTMKSGKTTYREWDHRVEAQVSYQDVSGRHL